MAAPPPPPSPPGGSPLGIPLLTPPPIPGIERLKKDLTASVDYLVAMTAIMIWDVISTFPSEFKYVWKSQWSYFKVLFFLNRYGSLVLQIMNMSLVVANVSPQFCSNFFWFTPFVGTYVLTVCGIIFALHVYKLYGRCRNIGGLLIGCVCGLMSTMASNGAQYTHITLSPDAQQFLDFYGCIAAGKPGRSIAPTILFWSAPFVFSLVILSMALYRSTTTINAGGKQISVVSALLRDGIWYLSVPVIVNLVSVVLAAQSANPNLHNFNAAGSISLNFVMASRLMLRNFNREASPTSSLSPGSRDNTPRFNPTFPSNNFAAASPNLPSTPGLRRARAPLDVDNEKYDRDLDIEAGVGEEEQGGGGAVEMERKCSEATLAEDRSFKSKDSDGTFQITGHGGHGIEDEIDHGHVDRYDSDPGRESLADRT